MELFPVERLGKSACQQRNRDWAAGLFAATMIDHASNPGPVRHSHLDAVADSIARVLADDQEVVGCRGAGEMDEMDASVLAVQMHKLDCSQAGLMAAGK